MSDKYLFRVYHTDDKGNLKSPFVERGNEKGFGVTEKSTRTVDDIGNEFGPLYYDGKVYPKSVKHYGFSAIGKVDPRYSIFNEDDTWDDKTAEALNKTISSKIPESLKDKQDLKKYYAFDEKNDYDFLTNSAYSPSERTGYISKLDNGKSINATSYVLDPKYFDFDSDDVWDDFVYDIDIYDTFHLLHPSMSDDGDKVVLVTAPEDSILSIDDITKKGYTSQRDFPSEIVSTQVTPLRFLNEYPKARNNYFNLRDKGATGKEAFGDSFKLDPFKIVSDKDKKRIIKDLSCTVNNLHKQKNILKGLKELGQ